MVKIKHFTLTAVATLIVGFAHASVPHQDQLKDLFEAKKVLAGVSSSKTLAEVVKGIADGKLNCFTPDEHSDTLISEAFNSQNKDVAKACIAQCVKLGNCFEIAYPHSRRNILHVATFSSPELLKMVLHDVPNIHTLIDQGDASGFTPMRLAIDSFSVENVRILKEAGANLNLKTHDRTPLEYAQWFASHPLDEADKTKMKQIIEILSKGPKEKL